MYYRVGMGGICRLVLSHVDQNTCPTVHLGEVEGERAVCIGSTERPEHELAIMTVQEFRDLLKIGSHCMNNGGPLCGRNGSSVLLASDEWRKLLEADADKVLSMLSPDSRYTVLAASPATG